MSDSPKIPRTLAEMAEYLKNNGNERKSTAANYLRGLADTIESGTVIGFSLDWGAGVDKPVGKVTIDAQKVIMATKSELGLPKDSPAPVDPVPTIKKTKKAAKGKIPVTDVSNEEKCDTEDCDKCNPDLKSSN